jgi:hypothetical protein
MCKKNFVVTFAPTTPSKYGPVQSSLNLKGVNVATTQPKCVNFDHEIIGLICSNLIKKPPLQQSWAEPYKCKNT